MLSTRRSALYSSSIFSRQVSSIQNLILLSLFTLFTLRFCSKSSSGASADGDNPKCLRFCISGECHCVLVCLQIETAQCMVMSLFVALLMRKHLHQISAIVTAGQQQAIVMTLHASHKKPQRFNYSFQMCSDAATGSMFIKDILIGCQVATKQLSSRICTLPNVICFDTTDDYCWFEIIPPRVLYDCSSSRAE